MQEVASQAEGYDAADLRVLVDRAVHAAARRQLSTPLPGFGAPALTDAASTVAGGAPPGAAGGLAVSAADLAKAREGFQPAAAWGVGQLQVCCIFLHAFNRNCDPPLPQAKIWFGLTLPATVGFLLPADVSAILTSTLPCTQYQSGTVLQHCIACTVHLAKSFLFVCTEFAVNSGTGMAESRPYLSSMH